MPKLKLDEVFLVFRLCFFWKQLVLRFDGFIRFLTLSSRVGRYSD